MSKNQVNGIIIRDVLEVKNAKAMSENKPSLLAIFKHNTCLKEIVSIIYAFLRLPKGSVEFKLEAHFLECTVHLIPSSAPPACVIFFNKYFLIFC